MTATVRREGRLYWLACYDDGEGIPICTEHLTRWGARRAARRWKKRQLLPVYEETI
jgi:hypothetical protein